MNCKNFQIRAFSFRIASAAVFSLSLAGCATDMSKYYAVQEKAIEADNNAVMALAAAAASGNQGAIMALALRRSAAGQIAVPQDKALQWASILIPGVTNMYAIQKNTTVQLANIEAETQQYTTTLGTIGAISIKGMEEASKPPLVVYAAPAAAPVAPIEPTTPTE